MTLKTAERVSREASDNYVFQRSRLAYVEASKKWLEPCAKNFQDVTEANPDICEIHYFTKPTTWEEE